MKKYLLLLLVFTSLTAVQCKKTTPEDQLPPITTTGANTFGCLVNGNVWLPYGSLGVPSLTSNIYLDMISKTNTLNIDAYDRKNGALSDINITVKKLISDTSIYILYNYLNEGLVYSNNNIDYEPYDTFGLVHIIHYDTIQKIVSGTFSFIGYTSTDHSLAPPVSITDGRFDLHYPLTIH